MREELLFHVLLELAVVVAGARVGAWLARRVGQPQVVGEIVAGLLLGPSLLARASPDAWRFVFSPEAEPVLSALGQLGLVFLMFLIGTEFEFGHLRRLGRTAASVAGAGIALPFALGAALAWAMHPHLAPDVNRTGFVLIVATALSITAIPILGRIMLEFGITRTRLGVLTISAAALDDALGWILLAAVSAIAGGNFRTLDVVRMLALTLGFVAVMLLAVRPLAVRWIRSTALDRDGRLGAGSLALLIVAALVAALATSWIGITAIFGPFVLGALLWDQSALRDALRTRMWDFVNAFFLPIFFTYTGLRTDVGLLEDGSLWLWCAALVLAAVVGKTVGCGLAARLGGLDWRESASVAVLMNTRALMGLIAINVGRDLGVIPDRVFTMLVIMALVTTLMTSPLLRLLSVGRPRTA